MADCINDGDSSDDQGAKDIGETINSAQLVAPNVIPDGYSTIYYARPEVAGRPLSVCPNPGHHGTYTFSFGMPVAGQAVLEIYDVAGRRVATPFRGRLEAGLSDVKWGALSSADRRLGTGVYSLDS